MSDNRVEITLSARDEGVVQALQSLQQKLDATDAKLKKIGETSEGAAARTEGAFAKVNQQIAGFVTGFAGLGTVLAGIQAAAAALKAEEQALRARQENARVQQMSVAEAVKGARLAFSADATMKDADLEPAIAKLSAETGASQQMLGRMLQTGFSAKGNLTNLDVINAAREAALLTPTDAAAGETNLGRFLDISKWSGSREMRAIAGYEQLLQQNSRVTDLAKVGANLVPAVGALVGMGESPETGAELTAALNQLLADEQGATTRTAVIQLGDQLKKFVPKRRAKDERGTFAVPQGQIDAFEAAATPTERIEVMQGSPELRRAFNAQASFEAQAKVFIQQLLSGEPVATEALASARAGIPAIGAASRAAQEAKLADVGAGKFEPLAEGERQTQAVFQEYELRQRMDARWAAARKVVKEAYDRFPVQGPDALVRASEAGDGLVNFFVPGNFDRAKAAGFGPEEATIESLRGLRDVTFVGGSVQDEETTKAIDELIRVQERTKEAYDRQDRLMREQNDLLRKNGQAARDAATNPANPTPPRAATALGTPR